MYFDILDEITDVESIAVGSSIREIERLRKVYGPGRWRKLKGVASVRLEDGFITKAELHWYECHGIGKWNLRSRNILIDS